MKARSLPLCTLTALAVAGGSLCAVTRTPSGGDPGPRACAQPIEVRPVLAVAPAQGGATPRSPAEPGPTPPPRSAGDLGTRGTAPYALPALERMVTSVVASERREAVQALVHVPTAGARLLLARAYAGCVDGAERAEILRALAATRGRRGP